MSTECRSLTRRGIKSGSLISAAETRSYESPNRVVARRDFIAPQCNLAARRRNPVAAAMNLRKHGISASTFGKPVTEVGEPVPKAGNPVAKSGNSASRACRRVTEFGIGVARVRFGASVFVHVASRIGSLATKSGFIGPRVVHGLPTGWHGVHTPAVE